MLSLIFYVTPHRSFLFHLIFFFFNDTATTEIYTLSLHDALPIPTGSTGRPRLRLPGSRPGRSSRGSGAARYKSLPSRRRAAQPPPPWPHGRARRAPASRRGCGSGAGAWPSGAEPQQRRQAVHHPARLVVVEHVHLSALAQRLFDGVVDPGVVVLAVGEEGAHL